ncbi:hypothetical protein NC651_029168 [Populus alba x Populus x berolinensis]|nr:hypothetical protein NC651_029168 [Populus alba x Populus x berolinensis]
MHTSSDNFSRLITWSVLIMVATESLGEGNVATSNHLIETKARRSQEGTPYLLSARKRNVKHRKHLYDFNTNS